MTATQSADAALLAHAHGVNPIDYLRARGYLQDVSDEATDVAIDVVSGLLRSGPSVTAA